MTWLLIGLGGFAGAISRYAVDTAVTARVGGDFPWGTFLINVSGSFLLGVLYAVIAERSLLPEEVRGPLLIGFIGAYTTFSTYMLETWRLVEAGSIGTALAYVLGSVGVGLVAVVVGLGIGRAI
jgi:CrcB protein